MLKQIAFFKRQFIKSGKTQLTFKYQVQGRYTGVERKTNFYLT